MSDRRLERSIYLDHNATTPVAPEAIEAATEAMREGWGNPGSSHIYGAKARAVVEQAKARVASLICANPDEILFVSGGTEADDLAILGAAERMGHTRRIVLSEIEHPAVLEAADSLSSRGWAVERLPTSRGGVALLPDALPEDTAIATLMLANNETGVLQPVTELVALARARGGVIVHTDAAQAVGKIPVDVATLGVDLLTIAGHKLYAPKGIGALYVRRGTEISPRLRGGGQQRGLRGGTEPVPAIAALGAAADLARRTLHEQAERQRLLRDRLIAALRSRIPGLEVSGEDEPRLPNTAHIRAPGVLGRQILAACPEIAASTGSACHEGVDHPSAVLLSMGISPDSALGSIRLSLGRASTEEDIDEAARALAGAFSRLAGGIS